jgi:excisionase family DNA binding protein
MAVPLLHTPEEAAELLRCKPSWLRERARRRDIPFTLIGGAYRFTDDHLNWIVKHFEQQPGPTEHRAAPRRRTPPATVPTGVTPLRSRKPRRRANGGM